MDVMRETRISTKDVRSLVWDGERLVDWASGGQTYLMTGETIPRRVYYSYSFDAAIASPSGEYAVIYTRFGTKGVILRRGEVIREINRSFYHANAYEYPVTMLRLGSGREVLVHCPEEYCRLEIEDLESGERLTKGAKRKPSDFFHSRLAASPDGLHLISAGWLWHPVDEVRVYDVSAALDDPSELDGKGYEIDAWAEESSATFDGEGRIIVALNGIELQGAEAEASESSELRVFDLKRASDPVVIPNSGRLGTVMAVGHHHLLSLWDHPKLIDVGTGELIRSWPAIQTGKQVSSIMISTPKVPPAVLDVMGRRFAVADDTGITVLEFEY
jgi:hypothetical protein